VLQRGPGRHFFVVLAVPVPLLHAHKQCLHDTTACHGCFVRAVQQAQTHVYCPAASGRPHSTHGRQQHMCCTAVACTAMHVAIWRLVDRRAVTPDASLTPVTLWTSPSQLCTSWPARSATLPCSAQRLCDAHQASDIAPARGGPCCPYTHHELSKLEFRPAAESDGGVQVACLGAGRVVESDCGAIV
jgi:hypothetical protein